MLTGTADISEIDQDQSATPPPKTQTATVDDIDTASVKDPKELVRRYAPDYGIDPDLAEKLADRESIHFRPDVVSGKTPSPRGAIGTMQLMPDTAKSLGVNPYDLHDNIRGGLQYLRKQMDDFGDQRLALAAYNAGPQAVRDHKGIPPYKETRDYVDAIAGPVQKGTATVDQIDSQAPSSGTATVDQIDTPAPTVNAGAPNRPLSADELKAAEPWRQQQPLTDFTNLPTSPDDKFLKATAPVTATNRAEQYAMTAANANRLKDANQAMPGVPLATFNPVDVSFENNKPGDLRNALYSKLGVADIAKELKEKHGVDLLSFPVKDPVTGETRPATDEEMARYAQQSQSASVGGRNVFGATVPISPATLIAANAYKTGGIEGYKKAVDLLQQQYADAQKQTQNITPEDRARREAANVPGQIAAGVNEAAAKNVQFLRNAAHLDPALAGIMDLGADPVQFQKKLEEQGSTSAMRQLPAPETFAQGLARQTPGMAADFSRMAAESSGLGPLAALTIPGDVAIQNLNKPIHEQLKAQWQNLPMTAASLIPGGPMAKSLALGPTAAAQTLYEGGSNQQALSQAALMSLLPVLHGSESSEEGNRIIDGFGDARLQKALLDYVQNPTAETSDLIDQHLGQMGLDPRQSQEFLNNLRIRMNPQKAGSDVIIRHPLDQIQRSAPAGARENLPNTQESTTAPERINYRAPGHPTGEAKPGAELMRADVKQPWEMSRDEFYNSGNVGYHGGADIGHEGILKRGYQGGSRTGQDMGALFFTESPDYAEGYKKQGGAVYERLHNDENIFDANNPEHLARLKDGFLKDWEDEYGSKEDALQDYQNAVKSIKATMQHGAADWATASGYTDQIEKAGFDGARFLERPGEISKTEQGFEVSGKPVYSVGIFKDTPVSRNLHHDIVADALREGKPVPPEVLADYPDLKREQSNARNLSENQTGISQQGQVGENREVNRGGDNGNLRVGEGQGDAGTRRPGSAEEAQKLIDDYENHLESRGIDPLSLWDAESVRQLGGEQNLPAGQSVQPLELQRLYQQRDTLGATELQRSIDGISTELRRAGVQEHDLPDVLKSIALDPNRTDALGQNSAYEHTQKLALGDPKHLAEEIYIKLAAKRGLDVEFSRTTDDIIHPDKQTLADARNAVVGIRKYFEGGGKFLLAAPERKPEPGTLSARSPAPEKPYSFTHERFAGVREAPDQSGVPDGKLRVLDSFNDEHIVRDPRASRSESDTKFASNKTILGAIRDHGGIKPSDNFSGELRQFTNKQSGTTGVVGKSGHWDAGQMASVLNQDGFRDSNGEELTADTMLELMDREQRGNPVYSNDRSQAIIDRQLDKDYEQHVQSDEAGPAFKQDSAYIDRELADPDSEIGRAFDALLDTDNPEAAADSFRKRSQYTLSPETIDEVIQRANAAREDGIPFEDFQESGGESGKSAPEQFRDDINRAEAAGKLETERNAAKAKAANEAELLRVGMKGGRANIEETQRPAPKDTLTPDLFNPQEDLFNKGSETGAIRPELLNAVGVGLPKLVEKDVLPIGAKGVAAFRSLFDDIRKVFAPAGRSPEAGKTAGIIRANAGEMARKGDIAEAALKGAGKELMKLPEQQRWDFVNRVENGLKQPNPEMQATADVMRKLLDDRRAEVQALGTGKLQTYIEDYFPHIWEDPAKAKSLFAEFFSKRPMEGSKAFLKQRTIPTIADGIAMGLKPVTDNPVDMLLLKAREIDRYVMAQKSLAEMKQSKIAQYVRAGDKPPDGFVALDDRVAKVYGGPDSKPQGGTLIRGQYYAPEAAARVFNNYLSPGLRGKPWFDAYLAGGNILNQAQLGLSAYHLGFTSVDAMVSKTALALQQLASGKFVEGGKSLLRTPIAPVENLIRGSKLLKEWQAPGTQSTEVQQLADAAMNAGGRAKMHSFYDARVTQNMVNAFKEGNVIGGVLRAPFAAVEQAAKPIMQYIVPRQKMGIFADLAKHEMEKLPPGASREEYRAAMARAWDSVDNRMGQMVYDNLFWDKTAKDLLMGSVRSVGWNLGTFRELGGGIADFGKQAVGIARGKRPEVTPRMAYTVALPLVVGALGAITQYLYTGKGPKELKDYYFPQTGNLDENGRPERVNLPSYMKDVYAYSQHPLRTMEHKANPIISLTAEMLENSDYYGTKIRNEDDPKLKQLMDIVKHVGTAAVPFGIRGMQKEYERSGKINPLPQIGITPAPSDVNQTAAEAKLHEIMQEKMPAGTRTQAEADKARMKSQLRRDVRMGKDVSGQISTAVKQGLLTPDEVRNIQKAKTQTALQSEFKSLSIRDALRVWDLMTPDEKSKTKQELQMKQRLIMKEPVSERPALQQRLKAALGAK